MLVSKIQISLSHSSEVDQPHQNQPSISKIGFQRNCSRSYVNMTAFLLKCSEVKNRLLKFSQMKKITPVGQSFNIKWESCSFSLWIGAGMAVMSAQLFTQLVKSMRHERDSFWKVRLSKLWVVSFTAILSFFFPQKINRCLKFDMLHHGSPPSFLPEMGHHFWYQWRWSYFLRDSFKWLHDSI